MPAAACTNSVDYITLTFYGVVDLVIEWTWDGASVPPRCFGTVTGLRWANRDPAKTYYGRVANTKVGTIVKTITPAGTAGASGREARQGGLHNPGPGDTRDIGRVSNPP